MKKKRKQQQGPQAGGLTPGHLKFDSHQCVYLYDNMIITEAHPPKSAIS